MGDPAVRREQAEQRNKDKKLARRGFLGWIWTFLAAIAAIEFIGVIFSFLSPGRDSNSIETEHPLVPAGPVEQFKPGTVTPFTQGRFYLVHLSSGGFLALSAACTHLGCSLPWDEDKQAFICPCHASRFDMKGNILSSPAQRPMDLYKVHIKNQQVFVDIGTKIRRKHFEKDQAVFPDTIGMQAGSS